MPEEDHRSIGLGIQHEERYYKREFVLKDDEDDNDKLAAAVLSFAEDYYAGKLSPVLTV